jgi:hypothetical protein
LAVSVSASFATPITVADGVAEENALGHVRHEAMAEVVDHLASSDTDRSAGLHRPASAIDWIFCGTSCPIARSLAAASCAFALTVCEFVRR